MKVLVEATCKQLQNQYGYCQNLLQLDSS